MKTAKELQELTDKVNSSLTELICSEIENSSKKGYYECFIKEEDITEVRINILKSLGYEVKSFYVLGSKQYNISWRKDNESNR
jgi:hypothetical protein